jgi:hypothetical protein
MQNISEFFHQNLTREYYLIISNKLESEDNSFVATVSLNNRLLDVRNLDLF